VDAEQPETHAPVFESTYVRETSEETIRYLLRARYPLLYLISPEESRVEAALTRIANERKKRIVFWSSTEGLSSQGGAEVKDPLAALNHAMDSREDGIFVFRDFHEYVGVPDVKRRLRDLAKSFRTSDYQKMIVVLAPVTKIPVELEKEFAVVDFDLPTVKEIHNIMEAVLAGVEPGRKTFEWKLEFLRDEHARTKVAEAALGLTKIEIENVLSKSLVQKQQFDIEIIHSEKEQIIRKSGMLDFLHPEATFSGVGGLDGLKNWLRKRAKAFTQEARTFGLPEPKGILLIGVPGCGKSLLAKAVGSLWKLPLLRLDVGKCFGSLVGASEENIRRAIKTAESVAPCILWLDELEKGLAGTQSSGQTDGGTTARVFGTFITWLQEKKSAVFVIGTANSVRQLPPELLRKGRFDEIFWVDLPQKGERREIFDIHLKKRKREPGHFDLEGLVDASDGFSGSEIEQAIISALYDAFDKGEELTDEYMLHAIEETVPLSTTMQEEINAMREWSKQRARQASSEGIAPPERSQVRKLDV
jgi:SpoVK/Ycf46/Vps4 family AAA+-type ATPase